MKQNNPLYGFEDYEVVRVFETLLTSSGYYMPLPIKKASFKMLLADSISKSFNLKADTLGVYFDGPIYEENKALLKDNSKLYVHPSCSISRSLITEKYKTCRNPWMADVVVMPYPNENKINISDCALFFNDDKKFVIIVDFYSKDTLNEFKKLQPNSLLIDACKYAPTISSYYPYNYESVINAKFAGITNLFVVNNKNTNLVDVLTGVIPRGKIVYENTLQESLSSEDNQVTLEVLNNISDMMKSSDESTVGAALKSLAMLDYMHYPNSIRFVLNNTSSYNYCYNRAFKSTPVKFMFEQLGYRGRRRLLSYDGDIYEQDYNLFRQLIGQYYKTEETMCYVKNYPFINVSNAGVLTPRIRLS